jgi:ankyrin repeat protein
MASRLFDRYGHTPLMCAVTSPQASVELTAFLIEKGALVTVVSQARYEQGRSVLSLAIRGGDPRKVALLIENGADVLYSHSSGYDALLDVAYSVGVEGNPHLVDLINLLIAKGAALSTVSSYDEAALSSPSCAGRFDAVQVLLDAGADPSRLEWTDLHRAVALGSADDVRDAVGRGAEIEMRDRRKRTPFLLAVQTGEVAKAEILLQSGASFRATGHCGCPALFFAIENPDDAMLDWLLRVGADIEQTDEFGDSPLIVAADTATPTLSRPCFHVAQRLKCNDVVRRPLPSPAVGTS